MKSGNLFAGALASAICVLVGNAQAATVLDQQFIPVTITSLAGFTDGSGFRRAQTFTVGITGTLTEVDIFEALGNTQQGFFGPFSGMNILSTSGGVPTFTVLGTGAFVSQSGGVATFSTSLPVTIGEVLAIEPILASTQEFNLWEAQQPSGYAGGTSFLKRVTDPQFLAEIQDNGFQTFVDVSTPLPGALPLFATGLGALGLLGWRRKRKLPVPAA